MEDKYSFNLWKQYGKYKILLKIIVTAYRFYKYTVAQAAEKAIISIIEK